MLNRSQNLLILHEAVNISKALTLINKSLKEKDKTYDGLLGIFAVLNQLKDKNPTERVRITQKIKEVERMLNSWT